MTKNTEKPMTLKPLILIFLISCSDNSTDEKIFKDPAIPETHVKLVRDSIYVDSLITLIPYSPYDSLRFVCENYTDSNELFAHNIFELKRVKQHIAYKEGLVKFWFTGPVDKTDSTTDVTLFATFEDERAIEYFRFRFNNKNEIVGECLINSFQEIIQPIVKWAADTIPNHVRQN